MIRTPDDIDRALKSLIAADTRLGDVLAIAGDIPLRSGPGGLPGLASTIVAQQVSKASADAIFGRLNLLVDLASADAILDLPDEGFRQAGLSRGKQRTLLAIAAAVHDGALDFDRISQAEASDAISELTAITGIGMWTAECYLLFSLGHPDVFPSGDLALQVAVGHAFALPERPREKPLREIASLWMPNRAVAARLFWAYYAAINRRDATPAALESAGGEL